MSKRPASAASAPASPPTELSDLKPELLDLIACPHECGALELGSPAGSGEVEEGELTCPEGHTFPIRGGIPRLVPDADQAGTFETFSGKWSRISDEEIEQRFKLQYAWYLERYGFEDEEALGEFLSSRSAILDAGTGVGGDAARFARLSDAQVIAFDLSNGIEIARERFGPEADNLHFVQGDILRPPIRRGTIDFVSSDQVIHHTPDAPAAFARLSELLAPGGEIAVYVYKQKALMRELADDAVRERTTRMSEEECMEFSRSMTELGRSLSELDATITLERDIPVLGIEAGEHDVQRLVYWHFLKCFWNEEFSENLNDLVNFDWYHPPYASRHTEDEVTGWVEEADLGLERLDVVESGISVLASRPAS